MAVAKLDQNSRPTLTAVSSSDPTVVVPLYADPVTHRLLTDSAAASGTVTSVSVVSANGFAGTVATPTTTPAITLTTTNTTGSVLFASSSALGQDNSNFFYDSTNHRLGLATSAPTHTLTQGSTGTGIALYNTADQTTNYERVVQGWSGNTFNIGTSAGGTGTIRSIGILAGVRQFAVNQTTTGDQFQFIAGANLTSTTNVVGFNANLTGTNNIQVPFRINPTISQSSTAGYTMLLVNPTESSTGSGAKLLADFQVGSASKFSVDNSGNAIVVGTLAVNSTASPGVTIGNGTTGALKIGDATITKTSGSLWSIAGINLGAGSVSVVSASFGALNTGWFGTTTSISGAISGVEKFKLDSSGNVTSGTYNKVTITAPATGSTLTLADGKTLTVNNSLTLAGTDSTTMTFPSTSATIARTDAAQTFTGIQTFSQVITTANAITATANAATIPVTSRHNIVTNNSAATLTITLTTAGAVNMQTVVVQILDFSAVAQTISWVNTENSTVSVPTTSNGSTTLPLTVGFMYNAATSKWRCIASA